MNIRNSGKIPEHLKKLFAAALALSIALCAGCNGGGEESAAEPISTAESTTHIPVDESSEASTASTSSGADSSEPSSISSEASETSSVPGISDSNSADSSETVSSVTSEPTSEPDPPPVVVVPTISVPYSPGTLTASGANGSIDYSNTSQGYISVRYTGSNPKVKLQLSCNGRKQPFDIPSDGSTVYIPLILGNGTYNAYLGENVAGTATYLEVVNFDFSVSLDSSLAPYLYPNLYTNYSQNSDCVYKAAELCAGKTSDIEKIAAVFGWITSNVTYDYNLAATVKSGYIPDPNRTYSRRTGICFDYASLLCAMLRSQSIPTRIVDGYASPDIRHAWNEVYTEETGWITPELLLKNAGYNIVDSTFYASSTNKPQIASYISNSVNYTAKYYY
ncbi:MAG: transglutaminase-like domain-containing protein [Oscillospiraceae bacterium]|nr:transglutaminase-like domain-containing protein [Oscillospiraceae bacterium]